MADADIASAMKSRRWVVGLNNASVYTVGIGMVSFILFVFLKFFTMPEHISPLTQGQQLNKAMQPDLIKGSEAPLSLVPTAPITPAQSVPQSSGIAPTTPATPSPNPAE